MEEWWQKTEIGRVDHAYFSKLCSVSDILFSGGVSSMLSSCVKMMSLEPM